MPRGKRTRSAVQVHEQENIAPEEPATKRANNGARAGKKGGKAGKKGRGGTALQEKKPQQVQEREEDEQQLAQMEEPVAEEAPAPSVGMEELLALRTTEQEKMAAKMRSQLAKHKEASDELVDSLKAQLVKLSKRVESCPKQVVKEAEARAASMTRECMVLRSQQEKLQAEVEALQQQLAEAQAASASSGMATFLSMLSGCTVEEVEGERFTCVCQNPMFGRELKFQLSKLGGDGEGGEGDSDMGDLEYCPLNVHIPDTEVPEFLQEEIIIQSSYAPVLLHKILSTVYGPAPSAGDADMVEEEEEDEDEED